MTDFVNPHFQEPRWLWLALVAPLLLLWLQRRAAAARRKQLAKILSPQFVAQLTRSHNPARQVLKDILLLAAVALMGLALARPQWGKTTAHEEPQEEDILFVLDCSRSMLATDVTPDRLQRAKFAIEDFVQRHAGGRIGLVVFAGTAFLECPLTFDHDAFEDALRGADERTIPIGGTDIGRALQEASRAMKGNNSRKLVLLITDGEDLEKGGLRAAQTLAKDGVVIYTVGVGTAPGAELHVENAAGQIVPVLDDQGKVVRSRLDEGTLRAIAQVTGGNYFQLGRFGEGLAQVRRSVEMPVQTSLPGIERFHGFIAAAIVLMIAESLTGTRRRKEIDTNK